MPILLAVFCLLPLLLGGAAQYAACRLFRRRVLWLLPAGLGAAFVVLAGLGRLEMWQSEHSPLTQLLLMPGLPGACFFLGLWAGRRLYRWRWAPRVIWEKKKRGR